MKEALKKLFDRDLKKLQTEIAAYKNESQLWVIQKEIANSAGNLCLHLIGNLNHFVGLGIGKIEYARDRPAEFSSKNIKRESLLSMVDECRLRILRALENLDESKIQYQTFPITIWESPTAMDFTLIHLYGHLNYHLGQINYHRRLIDQV